MCCNLYSQGQRIRIFEKKSNSNLVSKKENYQHLIVLYDTKKTVYIQVNQNKSWQSDEVNLNEWNELPQNVLVIAQPLEDDITSKIYKKKAEPLLLGSLTLQDLKTTNKEVVNFSISWSMNTVYAAQTSVQTSKKIEMNNCCENGTCSILISVDKKNNSINLLAYGPQ
ncbi:MAG: hypothetical protein V4670_08460 [Bacteroidota bacterium]